MAKTFVLLMLVLVLSACAPMAATSPTTPTPVTTPPPVQATPTPSTPTIPAQGSPLVSLPPVTAVVNQVKPAVVAIFTQAQQTEGAGSGFVFRT